MEAVFSVIFSGMVTSNDSKYGPIGVVFALMSWLIAIGVVIILGAVAGIVWQERNLSFRAAVKKLRPDRSPSHLTTSRTDRAHWAGGRRASLEPLLRFAGET